MNKSDSLSADGPIPGGQLRLADGLWRSAMTVLAVMPVGMAVAHRSSPAFLALSALLSLGATAIEGNMRLFARKVLDNLRAPLGLTVLAFFGWCLVSILWSEFKGSSLRVFGEFWLSVAAVFVLALSLAPRMTRPAFWLLAGAIIMAGAMMAVELGTGLVLRRALGMRSEPFIFNRPMLTLLVLMPPFVAWFLGHVRYGWACSLGAALLFSGSVLLSESEAAMLGLIIVGLVFPVAWFAPRPARGLTMAAFLFAMAAAPLIGPASHYLIPASFHEAMAAGHTRERVDLWISFGAAVRQQPLLGAGFGVSARMRDAAVAQKIPKEQRGLLAIGHPHNAALQIWAELGAVGIILALSIILLALRAVARQPRLIQSASLALIAGAAAVAFVGHGAWQGWWAASLGAAIIWLLAANRNQQETRP